jgi:hypothetical protein
MAFRCILKILLCCLLFCAPPQGLAGVTVITHGFNADINDWVIAMAGGVAHYPNLLLTNSTCYEIYFQQNAQGDYVPTQRKLAGDDPKNADSGEIIVKLDWSQLAGGLSGVAYSTTNVAPSIASALTSAGFIPELGARPLIELPLHLIGHSRGGSLICEITKALGQQGIWVDHLTTLDPHPLNNEYDDSILTDVVDGPALPYVNVLFADNYYQVNNSFLGLDPSGQFVPGAYNRYLNVQSGGYGGISSFHSNVHLWYFGTIDWRTPTSDSGATITALERNSWWTPAETNGASAGFFYSLIGGADRLSSQIPAGGTNRIKDGFNQIWDMDAGVSPNRHALPENLGLWPNLLTLNISATNLVDLPTGRKGYTIIAGESLPLQFTFQYGQLPNTNLSFNVFLDADFNPYSANEISMQSLALRPSGISAVRTGNVLISGNESTLPGVYAIGASLSDGVRTRYLYTPELLRVLPSLRPPEIALATVKLGLFQATVRGLIGQTVVVETSSEFSAWNAITTNTLTAPNWSFDDPISRTANERFYRAKLIR